MYKDCIWLPELIKFDYPLESDETIEMLYRVFLKELCEPEWKYKNKIVYFRKTPPFKGKPEGFYHLISDKNIHGHEYNTISLERAERILWGKSIMLNEPCTHNCDCEKIFVWEYEHYTHFGTRRRLKLYHSKYNYLIILENHSTKWLYITSYRVGSSQERRKIIGEYKKQRMLNHF